MHRLLTVEAAGQTARIDALQEFNQELAQMLD